MIGNFIVSLASYSKRIHTLHICLKSIFSQTLLPKKVFLYLDSSVSPANVPKEVLAYIKMGLEIVFVSNDIASHNKYYYTFQNFPDDVVITVDDDVVYDKCTFANLIRAHQEYPGVVCATRVTCMMFDDKQNILPYNNWISEYDKLCYPSRRLLAVGVGGILYPKHIFMAETFDKVQIMRLALTADDLWLKVMELKNNISVVWTGQLPQHPTPIPGTREAGLWCNLNKYKNDEYIKKLVDYYNLNLYSLVSEGE